jgi:hypothetical protein
LLCNVCEDAYCSKCYASAHAKGHKQSHTALEWAEVIKQRDWVEIWDDERDEAMFFNMTTKETVYKKPALLMESLDRHAAQVEAEKRKVERERLEQGAEIVKLKIQLEKMKLKEKPTLKKVDREDGEKEETGKSIEREVRKSAFSKGLTPLFKSSKEEEKKKVVDLLMSSERKNKIQEKREEFGGDAYREKTMAELLQQI